MKKENIKNLNLLSLSLSLSLSGIISFNSFWFEKKEV